MSFKIGGANNNSAPFDLNFDLLHRGIFMKERKGTPWQGVKVGTLGGQNERNSSYVRLAHTSILVCVLFQSA